jgi:two-component system NtrC family sensor kinase
MRTRIGTQVIAGVGAVMVVTIGLMAALVLRAHEKQLIAERTRSADQLGETIKSGTHYDMLENRRDSLHRQIDAIGRKAGIERVRVFNKEGRIVFSSLAEEIGTTLDPKAEACYACHAVGKPLERLPIQERARTYQGSKGGRVLGIIHPIYNEPACSQGSCHAHPAEARVLGVLDVNVSLAQVDDEIAASRRQMIGLALLTMAASGVLLWWLNRRLVVRPAKVLLEGTRRVAEGDLTTSVPVTSNHELGELARAFNTMTQKLAEAQRQIAQTDKLASVGRLAAGVAHEINNPLTGVLTYASFLLKRASEDGGAGANPDLREDLEVIVRETKRCREIVKGLLDFARQTPPNRQATDLNGVVRRALTVVMNQLALNRVALSLDLEESLPSILADGNQLQQVVTNLVLNAADATGDKGGSIRIVTRRNELPPLGNAPIRAAACPKGCNLLDATVKIGGLPAIRVSRTIRGREELMHFDPVYGRPNHAAPVACEEGVVAPASCPRCRTSLDSPERRCEACGAPTFAVQAAGRGSVSWCTRKGCHWSRWDAVEALGPQPVVELVVEDGGRGIAAKDLPHLFEPFFSTKGTRGTGLGLAVTWGIVEGHGGTVDVWSEEGTGTRFTVRLPLVTSAERRPEPVIVG